MPLFERRAAGVRLTVAGGVFARQARATVRDFERLHAEIDDLQQLRRGTIRIFSVEATIASVVYRAMAEFARSYPGITYEVQVTGGIRAIAPHPDVEEAQLLRDPIVAIMHPIHPLASRTKVTLRELASHPVALLDESHATRTLMDKALVLEGLKLRSVLTVNLAWRSTKRCRIRRIRRGNETIGVGGRVPRFCKRCSPRGAANSTMAAKKSALSTHKDLARKLAALENKYDRQFKVVFDAIRKLMAEPELSIGELNLGQK